MSRKREVAKQHRKPYRQNYIPEQLNKAYEMWKAGEANIYKAAKLCGVPQQTLRDRCCGLVNPAKFKSGPDRFLTTTEEQALVSYVKDIVACGYKITRKWLTEITGETAFYLKKKDTNAPFSVKWVYRLLLRWPELKLAIPMVNNLFATEPAEHYHKDLCLLLQTYDLLNKPHRIYNMFEMMVTPKAAMSKTSVSSGHQASLNASEQTTEMCLISCMNAAGEALPPYLVFQGRRISNEMLRGALQGTRSTLSQTGCTDSKIYKKFLTEHFMTSVPSIEDGPTLLLYSAYNTHIPVPLIEWAQGHNVLLFHLPTHASSLLQQRESVAFAPFHVAYQKECFKFFQKCQRKCVTRNDICQLAAGAYRQLMTPECITSSFRQAGIFPFRARNAVTLDQEGNGNVDTNGVDINSGDIISVDTNSDEKAATNAHMQTEEGSNVDTKNVDTTSVDTNNVDTNYNEQLVLKEKEDNSMRTNNVDISSSDRNYVLADYVIRKDGDTNCIAINDFERNLGDTNGFVNIIINYDGTWQLDDSTTLQEGHRVTVIV